MQSKKSISKSILAIATIILTVMSMYAVLVFSMTLKDPGMIIAAGCVGFMIISLAGSVVYHNLKKRK